MSAVTREACEWCDLCDLTVTVTGMILWPSKEV